jgi:hypothetical protein
MMRLLTLLAFLCVFSPNSWAQVEEIPSDSTSKKVKKVGFYFSLDVRRSVVRELPVRISGLKIGVTFKGNHSIGLGYYNMGRPIFGGLYISKPIEYDEDKTLISKRDGSNFDVHTRIKLEMAYTSLFYEHRFFTHRRWNMDVNGQFGIGSVHIYAYDKANGQQLFNNRPKKDFIKLVEGSVSVQYKLVEWLGLGAGIGYRYMIQPNDYISTTFNYPIWALKFILFPTKLVPVFKGQRKWYELE